MNKVTRIGIVAAVVAAVAGGSYAAYAATTSTPETAVSESTPSVSATPSAETTPATSDSTSEDASSLIAPVDESAPGQICDMNSMYTQECDLKYPETGYLNGVHRVPGVFTVESDATLLAYGYAACDEYTSGATRLQIDVVPNQVSDSDARPHGMKNSVIAGAAAGILCPQFTNR